MEEEIKKFIFTSWNKQISPYEWNSKIMEFITSHPNGEKTLCEYFIDLLGKITSKILFDYLEVSLGNCISPVVFFEILCQKQRLNQLDLKPTQIRSYVELIAKYAVTFRISKETHYSSLQTLLNICMFMLQSLKSYLETLSGNHGLLNNNTPTLILHSLSDIITHKRLYPYFYLSYKLYKPMWERFLAEAKDIHIFLIDQYEKIDAAIMYDIQPAWIQFCHAISSIADPYFTITKLPNPSISSISFMSKYTESINAGSPWSMIHFAVQFEIYSKQFSKKEESMELFQSIRRMMNWSRCVFYTELWAAGFKIEETLFKNILNNSNEEVEWYKSRWFVCEKIPLMISAWENLYPEDSMFYSELPSPSSSSVSQSRPLNEIEASLVHLYNFPQLLMRNIPSNDLRLKHIPPEQEYDFFFQVIMNCQRKGLVEIKLLSQYIPKLSEAANTPRYVDYAASHHHPHSHSSQLETLILSPESEKMFEQRLKSVKEQIMQTESGSYIDDDNGGGGGGVDSGNESKMIETQLYKVLWDSLITYRATQEYAVQLTLRLLTAYTITDSNTDFAIAMDLLRMFSLNSSKKHLFIFQSHGVIYSFVSLVFYYCETIGKQCASKSIFSSVLILLNSLVTKFQIKEGNQNYQMLVNDLMQKYPSTMRYLTSSSVLFYDNYESLPPPSFTSYLVDILFIKKEFHALPSLLSRSPAWEIMEAIPFVLYHSSVAVLSGRLTREHLQEGVFELCGKFLPAYYPVFGFLQNDLLPTFQIPPLENKTYYLTILSELFKKVKPNEEFTQSLRDGIIGQPPENTATIEGIMEFAPEGFNVSSGYDINSIFFALLVNSITINQKILHIFNMILRITSPREVSSMIFKEVLGVVTKETIGHGASFYLRAAHLGGCILGSYGPEVVAEEITQNLPLIIPLLKTTSQSQTLAHLVWTSCLTSKLYSTLESVTGYHSKVVNHAKEYLFLLITELLERLAMAPSPVLAFPITLLALAVSHPQSLKYAQVWRIARSLKMLDFPHLAMLVLNVNEDEKEISQFLDFHELLF